MVVVMFFLFLRNIVVEITMLLLGVNTLKVCFYFFPIIPLWGVLVLFIVNVANAKNQSFYIHTNDGGCDVLNVVVGNQFFPCSNIVIYIYIYISS